MAIKTATEKGCQIILANDPDADRLAVAERLPNGEWYVFNGNELGSILGSLTFENHKRKHPHSGMHISLKFLDNSKIVILASTVSCHFLEHFAEIHGLQFRETLSGFKWLGNEALKLKEKGFIPIFAFEEAIGYMIGDIVADKDGISSLAVLAENIENLYCENKTLLSYLNDLYKTYGLALSENGYFICYSPDKIKDIFTKFRFGKKVRNVF
jgi:phosphomannomutase